MPASVYLFTGPEFGEKNDAIDSMKSDFKKKFGYQMCVGCGRCDLVCPEYISFSECINKVDRAIRSAEDGKEAQA